ncbi:hypothetical protein [Massilia luteola]|uniref:hypothetical protein n=1 Tax=Massilia luteola TaxID=3081751 RepID=UPI002ACBFD42|nr:hypothetical protein [Massilia sp. Gc5]
MLLIRARQQSILEDDQRQAFAQRLFEALAALRPEAIEARGRAAVRAHVSTGLDRALARGIVSEQALWQWAQIVLVHGAEFDSMSWAAPLLEPVPRSIADGNDLMTALYAEAARRVAGAGEVE